jgi:hypothetical protein
MNRPLGEKSALWDVATSSRHSAMIFDAVAYEPPRPRDIKNGIPRVRAPPRHGVVRTIDQIGGNL